ncbi:ABC transporter permease [Yinghuangia sp. ASG 101]|uniref:ABC transporter permease n=1 Tax=Yinghuangia sp. ASG 101 TaxID=2896848 RepID=UPI001E3D5DFA|nr:ABC transporter permease [Yinghuangia sp. ASG 101]UGQ12406.1 ABC transporter permease [Yinghuangia sp. ASG 101]
MTATLPATTGGPPVPKPGVAAATRERRVRWGAFPIGAVLGGLFLAVVTIAALAPGLLAPDPPNAVDPTHALQGASAAHPFGTDQLGRDVLSRVIHGARPSLLIGLGATGLGLVAGSLLGVLAATAGKVVDEVIMRVTDVFLAFPGLLLAMLVVAVLGPSTTNATVAIGISLAPGFVRLARAQALVVRDSDYVRAAITLGRGRADIYRRHLLPNALPPLLVLATVNIGSAVIAGSSLSFLGLGPKAPTPEWGAMLAAGRGLLDTDWTLSFFPGAALTLTVLSVTVVGRALQRRFEGRTAYGPR